MNRNEIIKHLSVIERSLQNKCEKQADRKIAYEDLQIIIMAKEIIQFRSNNTKNGKH